MTRVDFHSNVPGKLAYACRLVRKAYGAGQKVIVVGDQAALQAFDTQLWTFSALDFLPHCGLRHPLADQTPILLADISEPLDDAPHHDILVNLSSEPPPLFALVDGESRRSGRWLPGRSLHPSFLQGLPWGVSHVQQYLPLLPLAIEQLDLSGYPLVLSSSHLVAKGVPFREAYQLVGGLVKGCLQEGVLLRDLPLERWQQLHPAFEADIHQAIAPRQVVAARRSEGGTGFEQVRQQLQRARARIETLLQAGGQRPVDAFHRELGALMIERCGISRTAEGLQAGLAEVAALEQRFRAEVRVPGETTGPNPELEKALRVAHFFGLAQLMLRDALAREESCGAHFREEHQSPDGEALRDDEHFAHIAAWEHRPGADPQRHSEPLTFTLLQPSRRDYR